MWAAAENHGDAVSILIERDAPVDSRSSCRAAQIGALAKHPVARKLEPLMYTARENALDSGRA
jgi:ankyrin repeat protein